MNTDTIAAIATGLSNGGISIIRISGSDTFSIIDRIYRTKSGKKILSKEKSHTIHYGFIVDGDEVIDEVMVTIMRTPLSYTKEDTVEINCHGGIVITRRVLEVVLKNGARLAEPGEYTKRAFLNGRIDLSQAEAVCDLINAKNELSLKNSVNQLQGKLKKRIQEQRDIIIRDIAMIEAALDDPEHMSLDGFSEILLEHVETEIKVIDKLIEDSRNGRIIKEGIKTVILGKPNAGKSSLLNALLGEDRAIVTDIAGTTRDTLEETINLAGITLNIVDTAGIRNTEDLVEKIGVDKAKSYAKEADLIIYVVDSSTDLDDSDKEILKLIENKKAIILLNKSDLESKVTKDMLSQETEQPIINTSVIEDYGIDKLIDQIKDMFFCGEISFNDDIYITNERHRAALLDTMESLKMVKQSILDDMPEDFYSIDLMNAYEALGRIIGENVDDDLIDTIFREFCMGK